MDPAIQLWQIDLRVSDRTLQTYDRLLAEDERQRANRFKFQLDRRRFTVGRGVLRCLLSAQIDQAPESIRFIYSPFGKPSLERPHTSGGPLEFNLSHSGDFALCVMSPQLQVGIDIEQLKSISRLDGMMDRCLTQTEQSQVNQSDNPSNAFLRYWTSKEAYLKAIGAGLTQSMQTVEISFAPPRLLTVPEGRADDWSLMPVSVPSGYVGALVTEGDSLVKKSVWQHPG